MRAKTILLHLLCITVGLALLAGCGGVAGLSSSLPEAATQPQSEPLPEPELEPEPEMEESSQTADGAEKPEESREPEVPGGTPVEPGDVDDLAGTWWHELGDNHVYQLRFEEIPGFIKFNTGIKETDAGHFYNGYYELLGGGVLKAELTYSYWEEVENPATAEVMFDLVWLDEERTVLLATLVSYTTANEEDKIVTFEQIFGDMAGTPLLYEKQKW